MSYLLIHGDARKLPVDPSQIDAVVTDPPYGIGWDGERLSMSAGLRIDGTARIDPTWGKHKAAGYERKEWDKRRPTDSDLLFISSFERSIIWGAQYFSDVLPVSGGWLIWDKLVVMPSLSQCELAWTNVIGHTERFTYLWAGYRRSELGRRHHPTQKPIALMRWCIQKLKLKPDSLILDPYCGSGSTLIAAIQEGHRCIGIDLDASYLRIAQRRLERPHAHIPRPGRSESFPLWGE